MKSELLEGKLHNQGLDRNDLLWRRLQSDPRRLNFPLQLAENIVCGLLPNIVDRDVALDRREQAHDAPLDPPRHLRMHAGNNLDFRPSARHTWSIDAARGLPRPPTIIRAAINTLRWHFHENYLFFIRPCRGWSGDTGGVRELLRFPACHASHAFSACRWRPASPLRSCATCSQRCATGALLWQASKREARWGRCARGWPAGARLRWSDRHSRSRPR